MSKSKTKRDPLDTTMSLGDHLEELRMRLLLALAGLVVCTLISLGFTRYIILFLERPYVDVMGQEKLQVLALTEGFVSYVKIALITALVISSPWVFYHVWMFVAAGLYPHERRYVNIAAPFSAALFIAGAVFFILIVAPISIGFLVKVNQWLGLRSDITFKNYITFVTTLMHPYARFWYCLSNTLSDFLSESNRIGSHRSLCKVQKVCNFGHFYCCCNGYTARCSISNNSRYPPLCLV
jgi:Tat protein translocase TatC